MHLRSTCLAGIAPFVAGKFPEYSDVFAGLVSRATERGSSRRYSTVEERSPIEVAEMLRDDLRNQIVLIGPTLRSDRCRRLLGRTPRSDGQTYVTPQ